MRPSLSLSDAIHNLFALGRHPFVVGLMALSLVGCATLGVLELVGIHIGSPTEEMIARQKQNQALARRFSDACYCGIEGGDPAGAIPLCQEAARLDPDSPRNQKNLGLALLNSGKGSEAIPVLERAIQLSRNMDEAHFLLANAYRDKGDSASATDEYQQAIYLNPLHIRAINNLGRVYQKLGEDAEAIQEYQESVRVRPDYLPAYDWLIPLLRRYERRNEAAQMERVRAEIVRHAAEERKLFVGLGAGKGIQR